MTNYPNVSVLSHPLACHKLALLRDKTTDAKLFRELIREITVMLAYESLRDIPTVETEVQTPLETTPQRKIVSKNIVIVPILRAGLTMSEGFLSALPNVKVGHLGMYRDEKTLKPVEYFNRIPSGADTAIILDPMLATGGSACAAIEFIKSRGFSDIRLLSIIAAPEGVSTVAQKYPFVKLTVAALDRQLNEHGYILPGLGDAGDRMFFTD
jgi:uracil phosphoribosyltransferase